MVDIQCPIECEDPRNTTNVAADIQSIRSTLMSLLSLSDAELSGVILRAARSQYFTDGTAGLDMNNSDVVGLNGMYFRDVTDEGAEGINFPRTNGNYDTLKAIDGKLLFKKNRRLQDASTDGFVDIAADTGWVYPSVASEFATYADQREPRYRKIGDIVHIAGCIKPVAAIPGGTDYHTIFTLPEDCRPAQMLIAKMAGSGTDDWWLSVGLNGNVAFSRYQDGGDYKEAPTTASLAFSYTFMVGS